MSIFDVFKGKPDPDPEVFFTSTAEQPEVTPERQPEPEPEPIPSFLTQDFFRRYQVPEADEETLRLFWAYIHDRQPGLVHQFNTNLATWKRAKERAQEDEWLLRHRPAPRKKENTDGKTKQQTEAPHTQPRPA